MKKLIAIILTALLMFSACAVAESVSPTTNQLELGSVTVYDFGDVKLHCYDSGDALADECYLVESAEGVVMIETGAFTANLTEWKQYIDGLNKPIAGALLAYHPNGIELFGDVEVYTTENALANWGACIMCKPAAVAAVASPAARLWTKSWRALVAWRILVAMRWTWRSTPWAISAR